MRAKRSTSRLRLPSTGLGSPCDPSTVTSQLLGSSEGILVDSVLPESPAASAGLSKGDILVEVGDSKLADPKALHEQMMSVKATEDGKVTSLKFKVLRKGEKVTVEVTPVERPADLEKLGITVNIEGEELGDEAKILTLDLRDKSAADIEKMVEGGLRVFSIWAACSMVARRRK